MSNNVFLGYECIAPVTINVDGEDVRLEKGDTVSANIVSNFDKATRDRFFKRRERTDVSVRTIGGS